jgi:hypothetical protein
MIGDVNLFLSDIASSPSSTPPGSPGSSHKDKTEPGKREGELEIMIAEAAYRGKGYAAEVLDLFIAYVTGRINQTQVIPLGETVQEEGMAKEQVDSTLMEKSQHENYRSPLPLPRSALLVRIGASNTRSIALFKKIGFEVVSEPNVFGEIEMRPVISVGRI